MFHIIRIEQHTSRSDVLVVHTPPEIAHSMQRIEWARYSPELYAYLIDVDALPGLHAFAAHINARIIDERRTASTGAPTHAHECVHCQQPGSVSNPPRYCPACGSPWTPVTPPLSADPIRRHTCTACGHSQTGRFTHCTQCSAVMQYSQQTDSRPMSDVRQHTDPQTLDTLVDQVVEGLSR